MNVWVLEFEIGLIFFAGLVPLLILPFLHTVYRRYGRFAGWPAVLALLTALYVCGVIAFVFFPLPQVAEDFCDGRALYDYWIVRPFTSIGDAVRLLLADGPAALVSGTFLQVFFNVLLFLPLGFLVAYRVRRPLWVAAAAGLLGSLFIEVTQGTAAYGLYPCPYRTAEVDDLILNTCGAMVGWTVGWVISQRYPFHEPSPVADLGPPTRRRRAAALLADILGFLALNVVLAIPVAFTIPAGASDDQRQAQDLILATLPFVIAMAMFVVTPLLRGDRATPGQWSVLLATVSAAAPQSPEGPVGLEGPGLVSPVRVRDGRDISAAPAWSILVRAGVRYTWVVVSPIALALVGLLDVIFAATRSDQRSLTGLLSVTRTVTRASLLEAAHASDQDCDEERPAANP